ncbi:MAG: hypothetical protein CAF45_000930 [Nitrospira sp. CG24E]|nr:MAG: hypothetical protein CAF45_000930 [Nitrospira sp. CG24E]
MKEETHMSFARRYLLTLLITAGLGLSGLNAEAVVNVQCPGDTTGDGVSDTPGIVCKHLSGSDGFMRMADGRAGLYIFGFSDLTGRPIAESLSWGTLAAQFAAPTLSFKEGDKVYVTLSNAGTVNRPDLFDPHSVHWHGFPNAGTVYDGEPDGSISINPSSSLTYYYEPVEVGTFIYHCHVEATEHMQMGMLGNLYVTPKQNDLPPGPSIPWHQAGNKYVYNDGDGSTRYDVEFPLQIGSMDPVFHDASNTVQVLPFANMKDTYAMLNGRGYPDTVNPAPLPAPVEKSDAGYLSANTSSNPISSLVQAQAGQKILLRISNLNVTRFYTLSAMGLTMKVVGTGAHILKGLGPSGFPAYYDTNSVTLGGGEAVDVIIDTTGVAPGTYMLYTTNLNYLSNNTEDFGGMMTEIRIL